AQQAGFTGIELRCESDRSFDDRHAEVAAAAAAGVVMPTVCIDLLESLDPFNMERTRDAVRQMRSQLSMIAAAGATTTITPISYGQPSGRQSPVEEGNGPADERRILLDVVAELAEHAQREGVVLALEPLNRYENHLINTLGDAVALCKEIGLPSVRVAADTYHMNIEEADPAGALLSAAPWLGHVQLSDSNGLEPGRGHLDWSLLLGTLNAVGYPGWLALECGLSGDATDLLQRSVSLVRAAAS
ncbi:MAG TPA: sugar phosphate isomerase/epimerase family protein, partial [Micromonosporaceae bacterium]|nr:sugar phosphate isomerase/epimerase family protein [Micromonosporaceae bacterium]